MESTAGQNWQQIKLLTVPEVAEWARVHPKTVHRWIRLGKLRAVRFGNRTYRIPESEIVRLLIDMGLRNLLTDRPNLNH
jgi:excisionase family DNA binding protein